MPKLWDETIDAHRRAVNDAILDTTAALVAEHGLRSVTMSQIAERTGIGRATLYKYFPDVEAILLAWHERQVGDHLRQLAELRARPGSIDDRLEAVLEAYALIHSRFAGHHRHERDDDHLIRTVALLHRAEHVARAHVRLQEFMRELLSEGVAAGAVRDDIPVDELTHYCLHTLTAAASVRSKAAMRRLVALTLTGLRPPR